MMENTEEIWKDIPTYDKYYQVSNKGNIRALKRTIIRKNGVVVKTPIRILKQGITFGYACVNIQKNGIKCRVKVHRVIALAFIPNPLSKPFINHINGIRNDNRLENLEWCTPKENVNHAIRTGLTKNKGEESCNSKLTNEHILKIRELYSQGVSARQISKKIGIVCYWQINEIVNRRSWNHI